MDVSAQDIADQVSEDKIRAVLADKTTTPEERAILKQALAIKNPPLTGQRKADLDKNISKGMFPEPGGQWAQGVESAVDKYAPGAIGPETDESTLGKIGHQAGATLVNAANAVLPLGMTNLANIGDLSDALFRHGGQGVVGRAMNKLPDVLPRSRQVNEYLGTAPSPMLAGVSGAALGMGATSPTTGTNPASMGRLDRAREAMTTANAPIVARGTAGQNIAEVGKAALAPIPRTNSNLANVVIANSVMATANEAQRAGQENRDPSLGNIAKESLNPVNVIPGALAGAKMRPYTETQGYKDAQRYARLRREGGGTVPRKYTEESGQPAIDRMRAEGDAAIAEARLASAAERDAVLARNKADISEAEAVGQRGVESAAVQAEREFGTGHRNAERWWMGEDGKPGEYQRRLKELRDRGDRVDPSGVNAEMERTAQRYAASSDPVDTIADGDEIILRSPSGEPLAVRSKDGGERFLQLGASVKGAVDSVKRFLGVNPSLSDYQNALRELDTMADRHKSSPSAKQAFTELAAKLRDDAYAKFPGFKELSEQHKAFQSKQERQAGIVYAKDEAAIGDGTREGSAAPLLPITREERGVKRLMALDTDAKMAENAEELASLSDFGRRAVQAVRSAKKEAADYAAGVRSKAERNAKRAEETGAEAVEAAKSAKDEQVENQKAVDRARFPGIGKLVAPTALTAAGFSGSSHLMIPMAAAGAYKLGSALSPYVRARVAYLLGEPTMDPRSMAGALPALSGPLALGNLDVLTPAESARAKVSFGEKAADAIVKMVVSEQERKRKEEEDRKKAAGLQEETNSLLRGIQQ